MPQENPTRISTQDYFTEGKNPPVYRMEVNPRFSPIDVNLQFVFKEGWSHADRLRFHTEAKFKSNNAHPLSDLINSLRPHLLIRRYDAEEDSFVSINIGLDGEIELLANDRDFAQKYLHGLLLECPPSFHSTEDLDITEEWVDKSQTRAMFLGLLQGALGWDPMQQIPPAIQTSLEEAEKALSIANYRSCVVMCRRTIEALLKFAIPRLLNCAPVDNKGKTLRLDAMIERFKQQNPSLIPAHLLHVLDSIRIIGNVPGAHADEIKNYRFSKRDAEFALVSVHYFLEQYFSKIDTEVSKYYTLTIDLTEKT